LHKIITLSTNCLTSLETISYIGYPREVCALLFGKKLSDFDEIILEIIQIPNLVRGIKAFAIRKTDVNQAIKKSRYSLIGFYHSHPDDDTTLSSLDEENILKSNLIWIVGAFKIDNENSFHLSAYESMDSKILPVKIKISCL